MELNPNSRWEFIKLVLRESAINYSKKLKEDTLQLENELQTRLLELEKDLVVTPGNFEEYQGVKRELYNITTNNIITPPSKTIHGTGESQVG